MKPSNAIQERRIKLLQISPELVQALTESKDCYYRWSDGFALPADAEPCGLAYNAINSSWLMCVFVASSEYEAVPEGVAYQFVDPPQMVLGDTELLFIRLLQQFIQRAKQSIGASVEPRDIVIYPRFYSELV